MDQGSTLASGTEFPYPPLPPKEDTIRVLTIEPGDFNDKITSTLIPVTFGARPKYTALSYTWGNPYPDKSEDPIKQPASTAIPDPSSIKLNKNDEIGAIIVNGHRFPVKPNLSLALRHLRSPKYPLALWVDAICIDQKNTKELNVHVAMMSFIYRRAFMVVAWLGTDPYASDVDTMRREWESGQTQHLAEYVDSSKRMSFSHEPELTTIRRITASSYWSRLWIVQEACLPHQLAFAFGSNMWDYEDLYRWRTLRKDKLTLSLPVDDLDSRTEYKSMMRLLHARESRHTEDMSLANLLERFSEAACSDTRDKVYGLLGLANDVTPCGSTGEEPGSTCMFKIDYSQSSYEVWAEVLKHMYFQAKSVRGKRTGQALNATPLSTFRVNPLIKQIRHLNIVRTSGLVQEILGQRVEEDRNKSNGLKTSYENLVIRAMGYISGEVLEMGPGYTALMSSPRSEREWLSRCEAYYDNPDDLETLRRTYEIYMTKILRYEDKDLERIRGIKSPRIMGWDFTEEEMSQCPSPAFTTERFGSIWPTERKEWEQGHSSGQTMCLCTGHQFGIVPSITKPGDVLIRFLDCSATIVMRRRINTTGFNPRLLLFVGRADVAEVAYEKSTKVTTSRAVYVDLDLDTLQSITASIAVEK
ncbi:hypothetical protein Hte_011179 [Hypoxylon texense]